MKSYIVILLMITFYSCKNSKSEDHDYLDTTAITVETPAIDTTYIDTAYAEGDLSRFGIESNDQPINPYQSQLEAAMADMSPSQRVRFLEDYERILNKQIEQNEQYKYNYRFGDTGNFGYNYDIEGEDENGNEATGNIDIQGKYGSGTITDSEGNEKSIEVEWVDYGTLEGTDEDGVSYTFHIDD